MARWQREAIGGDASYPQWLLLLPDAANAPGADAPAVFYVLPRLPTIPHAPGGDPRFALTLNVSRMPEGEEPLAPLVERGHLALTLDLSVPPESLQRLIEKRHRAGRSADSFSPLLARSVLATLDDSPRTVAISSSDNSAQLTFSAALDRPHALAVLDALDGIPGALRILLDVGYTAVNREPGGTSEILRTLSLEAPLHALLDGLLTDDQWSRCVRLVARTGGSGTDDTVPTPLRGHSPAESGTGAPPERAGTRAARAAAVPRDESPIHCECSA
jgi:hypothetical protein